MITYSPSIEIYPYIRTTTAVERIEEIGRVCYKSEDKIKEGSADTFVTGLIKRGHESVLEHANFCLALCADDYWDLVNTIADLQHDTGYTCFLKYTGISRPLVSGNARAWRDFFSACIVEAYDIPGCCVPLMEVEPILFGEYLTYTNFSSQMGDVGFVDTATITNVDERMTHHYVTVKFTCDRGVSHEFVRHRVASMSQESTRYCNYSGELGVTEIATAFDMSPERYAVWRRAMQQAEENYREMIALGAKPEEARSVLPNSTKTELVLTMNGHGWANFISLRASRAAHPQARELAEMLKDYFEENEPYFVVE